MIVEGEYSRTCRHYQPPKDAWEHEEDFGELDRRRYGEYDTENWTVDDEEKWLLLKREKTVYDGTNGEAWEV